MRLNLFKQYRGLRKELYILFIGRMMTNMGSMIWPIFTLILNQKLGLNASTIAICMLIFSVVSIPITLIGGKLADKLNKKNIIIICDLISVSAFIYCFFVEVSISSMIIFSIASLFQTVEWPSYDALVADFTKTEDRERAYSLSYLGNNLGLVLSPTIGGILFNNYLNLAFLINGLAILSSTILIFFLVKNIKREQSNSKASVYEQDLKEGNTLSFLFKNRVLLLYIVVVCLGGLIYSMYNYLMPLELARVHGDLGATLFGTVTSVNCIVVVVFTALITNIFKKTIEIKKMFIGEFLQLLGYVIFVIFLKMPIFVYVAMVVFTWGEIFNTIGSSPFLTKRIPASHRGRLISIQSVIGNLFASLLQIVVGNVYDNHGSVSAWSVVFCFGLILLFVMIILMIFDKKDYSALYELENNINEKNNKNIDYINDNEEIGEEDVKIEKE